MTSYSTRTSSQGQFNLCDDSMKRSSSGSFNQQGGRAVLLFLYSQNLQSKLQAERSALSSGVFGLQRMYGCSLSMRHHQRHRLSELLRYVK